MALKGTRHWNQIKDDESYENPYIHSYSGHVNLLTNILRTRNDKETDKLKQMIAYLNDLADILREEARRFLGNKFNDNEVAYALQDLDLDSEKGASRPALWAIAEEALNRKNIADLRKQYTTITKERLDKWQNVISPSFINKINGVLAGAVSAGANSGQISKAITNLFISNEGKQKITPENMAIRLFPNQEKLQETYVKAVAMAVYGGKALENLPIEKVRNTEYIESGWALSKGLKILLTSKAGLFDTKEGTGSSIEDWALLQDRAIQDVVNQFKYYFCQTFEQNFQEICEKYSSFGPEEKKYLSNVLSMFRALDDSVYLGDMWQWRGKLKEDIFEVVVRCDIKSKMGAAATGTIIEAYSTLDKEASSKNSLTNRKNEIIQKLKASDSKVSSNLEINSLKTFRKTGTYSVTDIILSRNGKPVRVQAKNTLDAFWSFISGDTTHTARPALWSPKTAKPLTEFLKKLNEGRSFLSEGDKYIITYLAANYAYFKNGYDLARLPSNRQEIKSLDGVPNMINDIIGLEVQNLIGGDIDVKAMQASAKKLLNHNVFFLIPGFLVPVYKIIENMRNNLLDDRNRNNQNFHIAMTTNLADLKKVPEFKGEHKYSSINLVRSKYQRLNGNYIDGISTNRKRIFTPEAAKKYGGEILKSIKVNRVNLEFNYDYLKDLATMSYTNFVD